MSIIHIKHCLYFIISTKPLMQTVFFESIMNIIVETELRVDIELKCCLRDVISSLGIHQLSVFSIIVRKDVKY
jgi:hypothetical protein